MSNQNDIVQPTPEMNVALAKRLNDAFATLAEGKLMQLDRPFAATTTERGVPVIALMVSPRDVEIAADVLEDIARRYETSGGARAGFPKLYDLPFGSVG